MTPLAQVVPTASVAALYRYPIKGFTPESRDRLELTATNRPVGDRVFSFRFPRGTRPRASEGLDYWPKGEGLSLRDFPSLARLRLTYTGDGGADTVRLETPDGLLVEASAGADAERITAAVLGFLEASPDAARLARPGHLPLKLVGDGVVARFQDRPQGFLSAHSVSSVTALSEAVGTELDERRFRSNISLDGLPAWAENDLIGSRLLIGDVLFDVHAPIMRCLAIHTNPETGIQDAPVMGTLTKRLGFATPTFGVLLLPAKREGAAHATIRVGDPVSVTSRVQTAGAQPESRPR